MAKKRQNKKNKKVIVSESATTLNAPNSAMAVNKNPELITTEQVQSIAASMHTRSIFDNFKPTRERIMQLGYDTLEIMADRNPIINAIINKRCEQMRAFCQVSADDKDRGFKIVPRRNAPEEAKNDTDTMALLEDFFIQTGFAYDDDREDDFADFVQLLVRDLLVFDQNATEIQRTNKGEVFAFWYVDGTSIKRVDEVRGEDTFGKNFKFVQEDQGRKTIAKFTSDDLIFDYSNKRARMRHRGYGYAKTEQCIDIITTLLFSFSYNKDLFVKDKIPKGFIKIMGDVNDETVRKVREAWISEMEGYGGRFKVPIVPSGKDGAGIDWQPLGQSNREMEYQQLVNMMMSIIGAVYGIDLAEIGIKTDNYNSLNAESGEKRIQNSKDSGLGNIVFYVETFCNKILSKITPYYTFKFTGIKNEDRLAEAQLKKAEVESTKTINQLREADGDEPLDDEYANVVLNPQAVQIFMAGKQAEEMDGQEAGEGEIEEDDSDFSAPDDAIEEIDEEDEVQEIESEVKKSLEDNTVEIII